MKQNYSVLIHAYATVLVVDAENEDEAREFAEKEIKLGDFYFGDTHFEYAEVEGVVDPANLAEARRRADAVAED